LRVDYCALVNWYAALVTCHGIPAGFNKFSIRNIGKISLEILAATVCSLVIFEHFVLGTAYFVLSYSSPLFTTLSGFSLQPVR